MGDDHDGMMVSEGEYDAAQKDFGRMVGGAVCGGFFGVGAAATVFGLRGLAVLCVAVAGAFVAGMLVSVFRVRLIEWRCYRIIQADIRLIKRQDKADAQQAAYRERVAAERVEINRRLRDRFRG